MDYRAAYVDLIARYEWPPVDDPRYPGAWEDMRRLLLARLLEALRLDPWRGDELEARLVARIGEDWYRPGRVEDVARLLEEVAARAGPQLPD
jgi:hypothetical protein